MNESDGVDEGFFAVLWKWMGLSMGSASFAVKREGRWWHPRFRCCGS